MRSCFLSSFVEFRSAPLEEKSKMTQPIRGQGGHLVFPTGPKKNKLGRGCWDLASCQVSLNSVQRFFEEKSKMSQPIRGQGYHLVFPISPKNTNLVEDVEILLPIKFRRIPFSGFRVENKNVSANQRPGRPSCFSDQPEKHKLSGGRWDLASCQVSLISVQRFQGRSRKCLSQSEARAAILFFRSAVSETGGHVVFLIDPKNTNLIGESGVNSAGFR